MRVIVIEPPSPIVSWDEMKAHGKIEEESEKEYVEALIAAATAWLDGPSGWLGRALGVQVLELQLSSWPCRDSFAVPYPPEIEVLSVKYVDPAGAEQEWPFPTPLYWDDLPAIRGREGDIRVRYRAGYGALNASDPPAWINAVPSPIKVAVMMLVAQWYENREAVIAGSSSVEPPFSVSMLLQPYRVYR